MTRRPYWSAGLLLLMTCCLVAPLRAAGPTLVIAPGEPGQRLDRRLIAALGDRLEAEQGPGAMEVVFLGAGGRAILHERLRQRDSAAPVILLHDPAVAAWRRLEPPGETARLVAYGVFSPAHRRWLHRAGAGHLDLLPVLRRHLSWVRHGSEARRLIGWVAEDSPLRPLEAALREGEGRLAAIHRLEEGASMPNAREGAAHVLLALPDGASRRRAGPLLARGPGAWCLMPEWMVDGCLGGVQPEIPGVAERLLTLLNEGGEATAPAAPRLQYRARHRVADAIREQVRYVGVPPGARDQRGLGSRLVIGALGLVVAALLAMLLAWRGERRRRRQRRRFGLDPLTGLPGRPRLERRMQRYLDGEHAFQLCWIAFDRLDGLREPLGPDGMAEAIRRISKRLRRTARGEGYVARLEGEVFVVMSFLPRSEPGEAPVGLAFAERLQESLGAPFQIGRTDRLLLPRIGVALSEPDKTPFALLEEAQGAARQVWRGGTRGPRLLQAEPAAPEERCLALTENLQRISAARLAEQLTLLGEPRVLLADRRPCGAEVRVGWRHPQWGQVPQEELLRLAEAAGRRALLDRALCRRAVEALARLAPSADEHQGPRSARRRWTLPVGVSQLLDADFIAWLIEYCEGAGLEPSRLELQLRGDELIHPVALRPALHHCREAGIEVALTGLGAAGRVLEAIFRQPLSRLVVEPALMRDVPRDQSAILLLKSLRDMAALAGRHVTVAGVATADQLVAVRGMNVVSAQGPLFGEARPLEGWDEPGEDAAQPSAGASPAAATSSSRS